MPYTCACGATSPCPSCVERAQRGQRILSEPQALAGRRAPADPEVGALRMRGPFLEGRLPCGHLLSTLVVVDGRAMCVPCAQAQGCGE